MKNYRLNKLYKLWRLATLGLIIVVSCSEGDRPTPISSVIPSGDLPNIEPKGNENY